MSHLIAINKSVDGKNCDRRWKQKDILFLLVIFVFDVVISKYNIDDLIIV